MCFWPYLRGFITWNTKKISLYQGFIYNRVPWHGSWGLHYSIVLGLYDKEKQLCKKKSNFFFALIVYFFLILFFNFTVLYWFCHISKWICHRHTCVPHPEPSSLLPPHTIPLGRPSAPAPSIQYHASNLDWLLISYMILYT